MNTALQVSGLTKTFSVKGSPDVQAVRGIDFSIGTGEIVALLGPNGAGKTSTIDMILGLTRPTGGHVEVFGGTPREAIERGAVSAVLQSGGLLQDLRVSQMIGMIAGTLTSSRPVAEVLAKAKISDIAARKISKCSGGEQQRIRFAIALLNDPDLLILDEPTAGMDVTARRHFWEAMQTEAERGKTILFATHYLAEAEEFAERTVIMHKGTIVADGSTAAVRRGFSNQRIHLTFESNEALANASRALAIHGSVTIQDSTLTLQGANIVELARLALSQAGVKGISITDRSLDEAFESLTTEEN